MRIDPTKQNSEEMCGATGRCSLCDERASAAWIGAGTIEICTHCAVEMLPGLIADAIFYPYATHGHFESSFGKVQSRFWKAVASTTLLQLKMERDARIAEDDAT